MVPERTPTWSTWVIMIPVGYKTTKLGRASIFAGCCSWRPTITLNSMYIYIYIIIRGFNSASEVVHFDFTPHTPSLRSMVIVTKAVDCHEEFPYQSNHLTHQNIEQSTFQMKQIKDALIMYLSFHTAHSCCERRCLLISSCLLLADPSLMFGN